MYVLCTVHFKFPERVAVRGRSFRAIHPNVSCIHRFEGDIVDFSVSGCGAIYCRPVRRVVGDLDFVLLPIRTFPMQHDLRDGLAGAKIDVNPLRIGIVRSPTGRQ
ncbi:hypothetical protein D3C75_867170 [compost metagenome]